jgi:glycosyltransferase involved in cell wall biosynthesis
MAAARDLQPKKLRIAQVQPMRARTAVEPSARGSQSEKLRIAHVFRAPLGGLFRHVIDLANEQAARGHEVGVFFDSGGVCERVDAALARIPGGLALGVATCPIHRNPGLQDIVAFARFSAWLRKARPDVVHGHGSKGGLYARLSALSRTPGAPVRAYTPHGGSFNYRPGSSAHRLYMGVERTMAPLTDVFLFESAFIAARFDEFVGFRGGMRRVVANGLSKAEFVPIEPNGDAVELLYVGELREAKGIDTLLEALPLVGRARGATPKLILVGSGPDQAILTERAQRLGVAAHVSFPGPLPIRDAFRLGKILVVPSRAESMPYVVLEAAAASVPMIATNVGGIPEIFGPFADRLGPSDDPKDLASRIVAMLDLPADRRHAPAAELSAYVASNFDVRSMADAVMGGYREALSNRRIRPDEIVSPARSPEVS